MPVALFVRRVGDALVPVNDDAKAALATLPPGRMMRAAVSKPRSKKQHGRVFAAIDEAFRNWPFTHEFNPEDAAHLRAWLLCRVGHVEKPMIDVDVPDGSNPIAVAMQVAHHMEAAKRRGKYAFARPGNSRIRIFVPDTINWERPCARASSLVSA